MLKISLAAALLAEVVAIRSDATDKSVLGGEAAVEAPVETDKVVLEGEGSVEAEAQEGSVGGWIKEQIS